MKAIVLIACLSLLCGYFVNGQTVQTCSDPLSDCSYEGTGVGVEFVCTNGGNCFCNNAEICNCLGNTGDCNCGYSTTCYCNGNDGDCCYTAASPPVVDTQYGDNWVTNNGVCYGDSSSGESPAKTTLIVVGVCLGILLVLLVIAAIIRRRRYYASLESNVVYSPVPSYGVAPTPVAYNPYQVPQSGYTPQTATYGNQPSSQQYSYYPTANPYAYTATSTTR